MALKSLADIRFAAGDELAAMGNYRRILEIDPHSHGIRSSLSTGPKETMRTISLKRGTEEKSVAGRVSLRQIPFVTETIGDLYLAQGHSRLAAEVFRALIGDTGNRTLLQKLKQAESRIKEKGS